MRANASTYRIDPTRIAIAGESQAPSPRRSSARGADDPGTSGNPGPSSAVGRLHVDLRRHAVGHLRQRPADAPGLFFHGTADAIVPYIWSVQTVDTLRAVGVPALLETQTGAGHVPYQFRNLFLSQTDYWFYDFLDLAHAAGLARRRPRVPGRPDDGADAQPSTRSSRRRFSKLKRSYPQYTR